MVIMAFGNGDKNTMKRMVEVGVGDVTEAKRDVFEAFRRRYVEVCNRMVEAGWVEPELGDPKVLNRRLFGVQSEVVTARTKSVYVERARLDVNAKIREQWRRFRKGLWWRLANASREIDAEDRARRWYAVPKSVEGGITASELTALEPLADLEWDDLLGLFAGRLDVRLTANQKVVLAEIMRQAREAGGRPEYGPDATVQLHMDGRWFSKDSPFVETFGPAVKVLVDRSNARYESFLSVTHPFERGRFVRIPLVGAPKTLKRLLTGDEDRKTVVLELAPGSIRVKVVFAKKKDVKAVEQCKALVGRDYGYRNTVALTAVKADCSSVEVIAERVAAFGKDDARKWLESGTCDPEILETLTFSGEKFLRSIANKAGRIDELRSEIDLAYNDLGDQARELKPALGLKVEEHIPREIVVRDGNLRERVKGFFAQLDRIAGLKARRRKLYDRIASVKKAWFGFLANRETELCERHDAALVRENLTVVAAEKDKPGYKGRAFNRMINNGSKGQYIRRASGKLSWNGVPELVVPSWYTSMTCHRSGIVDAAQRVGAWFTSKGTGTREDSDRHASETIACYLLLAPRVTADAM